jgi:hypothetical protein
MAAAVPSLEPSSSTRISTGAVWTSSAATHGPTRSASSRTGSSTDTPTPGGGAGCGLRSSRAFTTACTAPAAASSAPAFTSLLTGTAAAAAA